MYNCPLSEPDTPEELMVMDIEPETQRIEGLPMLNDAVPVRLK
jgi:hypothetical protein